MTIGLLVMLTLYGGWLVWVVVGFTVCYAIMRFATYGFYRRVTEEQVVKGALYGVTVRYFYNKGIKFKRASLAALAES